MPSVLPQLAEFEPRYTRDRYAPDMTQAALFNLVPKHLPAPNLQILLVLDRLLSSVWLQIVPKRSKSFYTTI